MHLIHLRHTAQFASTRHYWVSAGGERGRKDGGETVGQAFQPDVRLESLIYVADVRLESLTYVADVAVVNPASARASSSELCKKI
jgi:hypothetical protein